jgi:hypothetical protein
MLDLFEDFGDGFECRNTSGNPSKEVHFSGITNAPNALVTVATFDEDTVISCGKRYEFRDVAGLPEINGQTATVAAINRGDKAVLSSPIKSFRVEYGTSKMGHYDRSKSQGKVVEVKPVKKFPHRYLGDRVSGPLENGGGDPEDAVQVRDFVVEILKFWDARGRPCNC